MAVDSSNRFPEIKTHVKQVASYISFLFNTFYFNTWISSFDRWLILLTFTICTRRACRVDLYFQIGPRHKLTSETVKGHSPHMAQHGWIYHCRAARCMRQARAVPAYKTHPQLLIFAAVKKSAPYTRVFTVQKGVWVNPNHPQPANLQHQVLLESARLSTAPTARGVGICQDEESP